MYKGRICTKCGRVNLFNPIIEDCLCGVGTANVILKAEE